MDEQKIKLLETYAVAACRFSELIRDKRSFNYANAFNRESGIYKAFEELDNAYEAYRALLEKSL